MSSGVDKVQPDEARRNGTVRSASFSSVQPTARIVSASAARRSAFRQFYRLEGRGGQEAASAIAPTELDQPTFDADEYLRGKLKTSSVKDLLHTENEVIQEIRGLEGERKALVYDNYSKLISATESIRKMRAELEQPMGPARAKLEETLEQIARLSSELHHPQIQ